MTHLHIPDGVLPLWLVLASWLVTLSAVGLAGHFGGRRDVRRKVPLLGAIAALMLVSMSSEVVPIAYHVNLTVLSGILLGPWLSIIAAFIVNVILALVGHGGVTVIGLNTLMIASEMLIGWALFKGLDALLRHRRSAAVAGVATVLALAITTTLLVGIVALSGSAAASRESGAFDPRAGRFGALFSGGVVGNSLLNPETAEEPLPQLSVKRFATMVYTLGSFGWVLEGFITAAIIGFVSRVRPGMVRGRRPEVRLVGDEGVSH
ncbi:MAG: energy-coupling factor ABC transporter permease [Actinobacteria bacterium]|nr:energy-coupling factor ABC transporter permease [Actinomycetota bacterium]